MVALHLGKVPMVLPRGGTQIAARTVVASSALAVAIIGTIAGSIIAIQRGTLRRRQLRYRIADAAGDAVRFGLRRSSAVAGRVRDKLSR